MKRKRNKIVLYVLLGLLLAFAGYFAMAWRHLRAMQSAWIAAVAHDLITTTNSSRVIFVGSDLKAALEKILASPTGVESVHHGDAPEPIGDDTAWEYVVLTNARAERLGIRFRPASGTNQLEILGFWTSVKKTPSQ